MAATETTWLALDAPEFDRGQFATAWLVALATYGVGDVVTTIAIVWFSPVFAEANPMIRMAVELFGGGGFLGLKLLVFYAVLGISLWASVPERDRLMLYAPPLVLAVVGAAVTAHNLSLLF